MTKIKDDVLSKAIELIRGEEVNDLRVQNRNLLEENHRLRAAEGRLLEERGRLLGLFDPQVKNPRDVVWLVAEALGKNRDLVHEAECKMLDRIVGSIEAEQGMDVRVGAAIDKLRKNSYDKGWNEGIDKYKSALDAFFEILGRRLR